MDTIQVARTVKRIADLLQGGANQAQAASLAKEYVEFCQATSRRLEQCETMIKAGDDYQALQLAEAPPNLLDLITLLAFRGSEEWRSYCVKHQYSATEPFDNDAIRRLNASYSRAIPADHRLYKDYRQAVLGKKFEEALRAGRLIRKLNPQDKQTHGDVERLELRVQGAKVEALAAALAKKDASAIMGCVSEIEALNLPPMPETGVWKDAQMFLARLRLEELRGHRKGGDWHKALASVDEIWTSLHRYGLEFTGNDLDEFREIEFWALAENRVFEENHAYARALQALENQFEAVEKLVVSRRDTSLGELRLEATSLDARWAELNQLGRPHSEAVDRRRLNAQKLLEATIAAQEAARKKRLIIQASSAVCALVMLAEFIAFWRLARSDTQTIRNLIAARDVHGLSSQVLATTGRVAARLNVGGLGAALRDADYCLAKENGLKANFEKLCQELQRVIPPLPAEPPPARLSEVQKQVEELGSSFRALAPEFRANAEPCLASVNGTWLAFLEPRAQSVRKSFEVLLKETEQLADHELHYTNSVEQVILAMDAELKPRIRQLKSMTEVVVPALRVSSNFLADFEKLSEKVATFDREATNYSLAIAALAGSRTREDYLSRLGNVSASPFRLQISGSFLSLTNWRSASSNVVGTLLFPNDSKAWECFLKSSELLFRPAGEFPKELKSGLSDLLSEDKIAHITRYVVRPSDGTGSPVFLLDITGQGLDRKKVGGKELCYGSVYDPAASPNLVTFQNREYEPWRFGDQLKKRPLTPERDVLVNTGFRDLAEERGDKTRGLLDCLDALNRDKTGNPLCRAWIFVAAAGILESNRCAWGGQYAPAVAVDAKQILRIVGGTLKSEDWMLPAKQYYTNLLQAHFDKAASISYVRQARFLHALARETVEAGVDFAGYVDAHGKVVLTSHSSVTRDFLGWGRQGLSLQVLARKSTAGSDVEPVQAPAPLSPVFALRQDCASIRERAAAQVSASLGDPSVSGWLPPLFTTQ